MKALRDGGHGARAARVVLGAALLAFVGGCAPPGASPAASPTATPDPARPLPSPLPRIAATVNGRPIFIERVALEAREEQARASDRTVPDPTAVRGALRRLIDHELLLQEALVRGVRADARGVERAYDAARGQQADETAWYMFLARQGLTADTFRAELRERATVNLFRHQLAARIDPGALSEDEVRAFYAAHPELSPEQPPLPFEAVAQAARAALAEARAAEQLEALLKTLAARARIETFL